MKKRTKLIAFLGLSLLLTGCKEIIAKPTTLDNPLVDNLSHDINNVFTKIYDNYRDSSGFKQLILDEVLHLVAVDKFGEYEDLEDPTFKAAVDERIKEKFYNEISATSYQERSFFQEEQYIREKIYGSENKYIIVNGEKLTIKEVDALDESAFYSEGLFLPAVDKTNFDDPSAHNQEIVHYDYYSDYVLDTFLKDVYREKLVEQYVIDEQSHILGRNYARKVNYIALKDSKDHPNAVSNLVHAFIDENIIKEDGDPDLNILANAWRGNPDDFKVGGNEAALLTKAGLTTGGKNHTLTGDVWTEFNKINDDPNLTNLDAETRFTGGNKYLKEEGLEIELNDVRKKSFVTTEWGIKSGGITGLPDALRNRVFNISTANGVDSVLDDEGTIVDAGKMSHTDLRNTFVRNIHGKYYLTPKIHERNDNRNFLFYENETYYIVQIEEAVNTAKLTEGNSDYYLADGGKFVNDEERFNKEIVSEIARILAELEATKTNAFTHYLEQLNIVFHDEEIKEFFASKFPEIFGDDDE